MASGKNFWWPKFWQKSGDGDHFTVKGLQKATFWKSELGALPNVYKHYKFSLNGMCINVIPYLWVLSSSFSNSFIDFHSSKVISSSEKEHTISKKALHPVMVVVLKHYVWLSSCKMFPFCDVLHETKQKVNLKLKKTQTNCQECAIQTWNHDVMLRN